MPEPRIVAVANPGGKRWLEYSRAVADFARDAGLPVALDLVPWRDLIDAGGSLAALPAFDRPAVVRLESPGRDWDVTRRLIARGAREVGLAEAGFLALEPRRGWLAHPALFYRGFHAVLADLERGLAQRPDLVPLSRPLEVAEMFDKNATCARLETAGIPVPPWFPGPTTVEGLLAEVSRRGWPASYVKLNTGSSASAIAVLRQGPPAWAVSSAVRVGGAFASSRRLARYEGDDLEAVLAFLLGEGANVQRGLRMARIDGQNFDVRVVVVRGQPAFTVFRLSDLPMTNLHLGGQRGDPARCRAAIPPRVWLDGLDDCVAAAGLYGSEAVGVDLLFEEGLGRHAILEVNAFGDFFPGLTDARGRSVHCAELDALARVQGW